MLIPLSPTSARNLDPFVWSRGLEYLFRARLLPGIFVNVVDLLSQVMFKVTVYNLEVQFVGHDVTDRSRYLKFTIFIIMTSYSVQRRYR